jgi:hypothetical protein
VLVLVLVLVLGSLISAATARVGIFASPFPPATRFCWPRSELENENDDEHEHDGGARTRPDSPALPCSSLNLRIVLVIVLVLVIGSLISAAKARVGIFAALFPPATRFCWPRSELENENDDEHENDGGTRMHASSLPLSLTPPLSSLPPFKMSRVVVIQTPSGL